MTLEKLAKQIFEECAKDGEPITMEEATEMAQMEIGAKDIKNYTQAEPIKTERKPRERKVDNEKLDLLSSIESGLKMYSNVTCTYENEVKLHFSYNGSEYSVTLTKHRPKKG